MKFLGFLDYLFDHRIVVDVVDQQHPALILFFFEPTQSGFDLLLGIHGVGLGQVEHPTQFG